MARAWMVMDRAVSRVVKAAFVGAKTVNGPAPVKVVAKSALLETASARTLKSGVDCAVSTMFKELPMTASNDISLRT